MSNRIKSSGPFGLRDPLLHALDVEYARASRVKNIGRMAEIREIVDAIRRLLPGVVPEPPAEAQEPVLLPVAPSLPPEATPAFYSLPTHAQSMPATNLRMASLQSILTRAEDGPPVRIPAIRVPEAPAAWRQRAKNAVLKAVAEASAVLAAGRPLYEQALMARNGKIEPLAGLKLAASIQGISVETLVEQLIAEYDAKGRRAMYVHTLHVQANRDIDNAGTGDEADAIAAQAVKDIIGEDE